MIVLATTNRGKVAEIERLLEPLAVVPQSRFTTESIAETGLTFVENAILKARYAARVAQMPALADDSGLEVDALQGAPGIYSARYAGDGASDAANCEKLLAALHGVPTERRRARFRCVVVYMRTAEDPAPLICQGTWEGVITERASGTNGFGYDPIFRPFDALCTAAELSPEHKNQVSHRAQALRTFAAEWGRWR